MVSLKDYKRKRRFSKTPEPIGGARKPAVKTLRPRPSGSLRFVVHLHRATKLHYDFRLEFGGVFKSWAVPKKPSLNPLDQRLAIFVEDHPIEYGEFEGIIPKGNYGAGTVMIWDEGSYIERHSENRQQSEQAMQEGLKNGHLSFVLNGHKLNGEFALIRLKKGDDPTAWLLVKKRDAFSTYRKTTRDRGNYDQHMDLADNRSVQSGRTLEEIAAQSQAQSNALIKPLAHRPMPRKNRPMLATVTREMVKGSQWIFEPEIGGLRALAEVDGQQVHLYSKSGLSYNKRFPEIVETLRKLKHSAVFDGEILTHRAHTIGLYKINAS